MLQRIKAFRESEVILHHTSPCPSFTVSFPLPLCVSVCLSVSHTQPCLIQLILTEHLSLGTCMFLYIVSVVSVHVYQTFVWLPLLLQWLYGYSLFYDLSCSLVFFKLSSGSPFFLGPCYLEDADLPLPFDIFWMDRKLACKLHSGFLVFQGYVTKRTISPTRCSRGSSGSFNVVPL